MIWGAHAPPRDGDDALVIAKFFSVKKRVAARAGQRTREARVLPISLCIIHAVFLCVVFASPSLAADFPRDPDYDYDPPVPGSYSLPVVKPAADGALLDSDGTALNLRDLTHGRITVLSFIYTRCAAGKACPYATGVMNQLHQVSVNDRTLATNLRLVSMSFDPEYDTPQRLAAYSESIRDEKPGCEWRFVTAKSQVELQPILAAYGQIVDERSNPADPQGPLYHVLRVFLIDRDGRIRNVYSSGTLDPRLVLADVKTLLLEESKLSNR